MRDPLGPTAYRSPTTANIFRKKKRKPLSKGIYSSVFPKAGVTPKTSPGTPPPTYPGGAAALPVQGDVLNPAKKLPTDRAQAPATPTTPGYVGPAGAAPSYAGPFNKLKARKRAAQNLWKVWWA